MWIRPYWEHTFPNPETGGGTGSNVAALAWGYPPKEEAQPHPGSP